MVDMIERGNRAQPVGAAAADRCPYPRPFPAGFSGCPAFHPATQAIADSLSRRTESVVTCAHLRSGTAPGLAGHFYPRCALGSAQQRDDWLAVVGRQRLDALRALGEEFDRFTSEPRERLFNAKAELIQGGRSPAARARLDRVIAEYLEVVEQYLTEHEARFVAADLPVKPLGRLLRAWCRAWSDSQQLNGAGFLQDMSLSEFGPEAQALLRPTSGQPWFEPVYQTDGLRVVRTWQPDGLRIAGHVDVANANALARVLDVYATGTQATSDVVVDLSEVTFCDLDGLRALVRTAAGMAGGGQLVIRGMSSTLQRALELSQWSERPTLVIAPAEGIAS